MLEKTLKRKIEEYIIMVDTGVSRGFITEVREILIKANGNEILKELKIKRRRLR